jgi:hypothetical protein
MNNIASKIDQNNIEYKGIQIALVHPQTCYQSNILPRIIKKQKNANNIHSQKLFLTYSVSLIETHGFNTLTTGPHDSGKST